MMISTVFLTNECPKLFQAPNSIWFCKVGLTETTLIKLVDFGFVLFTDQQPLELSMSQLQNNLPQTKERLKPWFLPKFLIPFPENKYRFSVLFVLFCQSRSILLLWSSPLLLIECLKQQLNYFHVLFGCHSTTGSRTKLFVMCP